MPVDVQQIFRGGGRPLIDLLEYVVLSVDMDAMFLFLVDEYRMAPTTDRALALYDCFCAADAPAPIRARPLLPPKDLRLPRALAPYRGDQERLRDYRQTVPQAGDANDDSPPEPPPGLMLLPPKYLFDAVAEHLKQGTDNPLRRVGTQYNPDLSPRDNLPGGKLTASQKFFVDYVWGPKVRPCLATAGFRRVANIA